MKEIPLSLYTGDSIWTESTLIRSNTEAIEKFRELENEIWSFHQHLNKMDAPLYDMETGRKLLIGERLDMVTGENAKWIKIK